MSWYNNQNEGFIDATQILQSGGGGGGASQTELNEINQDITDINANLAEINGVFIPKQLNTENATTDTIIVNNTANSRIFLKNQNTTPKIKIEGGKLYLYYDYDLTNAPTITAGWIDVDNYITAIKQSVIGIEVVLIPLELYVFGTSPTQLQGQLLTLGTITNTHSTQILTIQEEVSGHTGLIAELRLEVNYLNNSWFDPMSPLSPTTFNQSVYNQRYFFDEATRNAITQAGQSAMGSSLSRFGSAVASKTFDLATSYLNYVLVGLGGAGVVVGLLFQLWDSINDENNINLEKKLLLLYEKLGDNPANDLPKHIHINGLLIIESTNNGLTTIGNYTITLSNTGILIIEVKLVGTDIKAVIKEVKEVGTGTFNIDNIINIPKSQIGGTSGDLQIQITSLISERQVIINELAKIKLSKETVSNRRRLRDGIINTNELGDGLTTEYNSTITNAETGEVLQVPTIKLKINTDQLKLLNGTLNINKYVNQDNIDIINGNIATHDLEIADINDSLERVYKVILPDGETMTSGYKLNLGYKEIFTGYACDLMMLAVNKNTYVSFDADNYNNDYLGYFPNMARVAMTGDVKVISQNNLLVNTADQFTKGFIFLKNSSEFSTYNLNRKFEFLCFLKFVSFNNNSTDYHILQSGIDLITQVDIDTTRLGVWIRNRKLKLQHPALVEYMEYGINPTNVLTRYIVNNNYFRDGTDDDNIFILAQQTAFNPDEYKYSFNLRSSPYYGMYNNLTTLIRIINDAYTTEQNEDTNYIIFYLSHPNDPSRPIANCGYSFLEYLIDYPNVIATPPTYIKRVTIKFDILFSTQTSVGDPYPQMTQQSYADTVAKCDFTFQILYTFNGSVNQIQHNFTMADVNPTFTTTGTTYFDGWGGSIGGGQIYFPKRYWTYSFDIVGTYPNVGQQIKSLTFKLVPKPNAVYQYGTTAVNRYNNQPMLYLFKYIIQDYNPTETPKQAIYNNYTTTETSLALSSGIFNNKFYLFNLQLDLPNDIINYYLDGTYYNFSARTVNKIYSTDVVFPDPTIPFFNANFVSWANLTQDNSVLVVGNIPSTGSIQFSHFNWRFFQNTEQFFTVAEMNKLKELIAFNYYYDYVSVDKLLDTNEISANNITTRQLVINNNPLVANFTSATRSRDLRSDQTQEAGNVLIEIKNLYVENPSNSGTLNYNLNTKTFSIGSGGSGIGTRSEEDAIILGFIEDSAGTGLQWNATNNTLNVIPESLWQDLTPIYTLISTNDQNVSNYVWETSNYLKSQIDGILPYDDTAVYALINTNDQNVSNYVWETSNYIMEYIISNTITGSLEQNIIGLDNNELIINDKPDSSKVEDVFIPLTANNEPILLTEERSYPPIRNFTSGNQTVSGEPYGNGTYVVSYSSTYGGGLDPFKCFNTSDGAGGAWGNNRYTSESGDFNSTSFIVAGYLGDWLKIQLPVPIILTSIAFIARTSLVSRAPRDYKIYGSNDGTNWVELISKVGAVYNTLLIHEQTTSQTTAYSHYALVVNKIIGGTNVIILNFDEWYINGKEIITAVPEGNPITHKTFSLTHNPITLTHDFTNFNDLTSWTNYATSKGMNVAGINTYDAVLDAVNNPTGTGSLNYRLPPHYNFVTVSYGNPSSANNVVVRINGIDVSTCTPSQFKTHSQSYNKYDLLTVLEGTSIMSANIIITVSNSSLNTYSLAVQSGTSIQINNQTAQYLSGNYIINVGETQSSVLGLSGQTNPYPLQNGSSIDVKYSMTQKTTPTIIYKKDGFIKYTPASGTNPTTGNWEILDIDAQPLIQFGGNLPISRIDNVPPPYDDTAVYTLISTNDQNVSNYVWETSNYLKSQIDGILPYDDTAVYALINTNDQNVSNYVWETSNYLKSQIDGILPYDDTAVYTQITTTSNILLTDFVARDALLTTDYIARDDIITADSIERDDNLSASIEANKYTDTKVLTYLQNTATKNFGGFVGIGTTNPLALLELKGQYGTLRIVDSDITTSNPRIDLIRGTGYFGTDGQADWRVENLQGLFRISRELTSYTPPFQSCLSINQSGDVGFGTDSVPFAKLHLHKNSASQDVRIQFTDTTTGSGSNNGTIVGKLADGRGFLYNYQNTELFFGTNSTQRMMIMANGNVGIGTTTTTSKLRVEGSCTINGFMTAFGTLSGSFLSVANSGVDMLCIQVTTTQGLTYTSSIRVAFGTFTGFHRCYTSDILYNEDESDIFKNKYAGRLVVATGKIKTDYSDENNEWKSLYDKEAITYEDAVPIVELSRVKKDKRIFGVLGLPNRASNNKNRLIVNSVGEGAICVANSNGNIENGDYLQSSDLLGYAEKQDDDILHNYTCAKATMNCNFELNSPYYQCYEENGVRYALIACSYHCG